MQTDKWLVGSKIHFFSPFKSAGIKRKSHLKTNNSKTKIKLKVVTYESKQFQIYFRTVEWTKDEYKAF